MDFEKAYQKFLDGTASDEEVEFVRSEIKKARKLTEIIDRESPSVVAEASDEAYKKAAKKHRTKTIITIVFVSLLAIAILAAAAVLIIHGVTTDKADTNTRMSRDEARELAISYIEENYADVPGEIFVEDVECDLESGLDIGKAYYEYSVELKKGNMEFEVEINGHTGEIIYVDADYDD